MVFQTSCLTTISPGSHAFPRKHRAWAIQYTIAIRPWSPSLQSKSKRLNVFSATIFQFSMSPRSDLNLEYCFIGDILKDTFTCWCDVIINSLRLTQYFRTGLSARTPLESTKLQNSCTGIPRVGHESTARHTIEIRTEVPERVSKRDEIKLKGGEVDCACKTSAWDLDGIQRRAAPCRVVPCGVLSEGRTRPCRRCIWLSHYLVVCGRHSTFRRYVNVVYSTVQYLQRWGGRGVAMISSPRDNLRCHVITIITNSPALCSNHAVLQFVINFRFYETGLQRPESAVGSGFVFQNGG